MRLGGCYVGNACLSPTLPLPTLTSFSFGPHPPPPTLSLWLRVCVDYHTLACLILFLHFACFIYLLFFRVRNMCTFY